MKPLTMTIEIEGKNYPLTVNEVDGIYEIVYQGKIIAALHPPGEDWRLLPIEEVLDQLPIYEFDLSLDNTLKLHTTHVNEIVGRIETHLNSNI
jgi:hypothetical protein